MEPRNCSYLHFISVIRGGEVIKTPNLSRVKKLPKFRNIGDIYVSIRSTCETSPAKRPLKVDRSLGIPHGCSEVRTEVKTESTEAENESEFDSMTLKQFKETCKSKKRKASASINLMAVKQEYVDSEHQEDELDLKETLGSWKRKLSKKTKNKKGTIKDVSLSSKNSSLQGSSNCAQHNHTQQESSWEILEPIRIKVEDAEFDCSQPQAICFILPDHPGNPTSEVLGAMEESCPDQEIKTILAGLQSLHLYASHEHFPHPVSNSARAQNCVLNQETYEHLDNDQSINEHTSGDFIIDNVEKVSRTVVTGDQSLHLGMEEPRKQEGLTDFMMCDEASVQVRKCALNRVSYEHLESIQLQNPLMSEDYKMDKNVEISGQAISDKKYSVPAVVELKDEEGMTIPMTCDEAPETVFLVSDGPEFRNDNPHYSGAVKIPGCIDDSIHVQGPCASPGRISRNIESTENQIATCTLDNDTDIEAEVSRSVAEDQGSTVESVECLLSANNMESRALVASAVEDEQSTAINVTTANLTSSADNQPCASRDLLIGSSTSESCERNVPRPPERLFSARKTISPNSQERLCRVMNSIEQQEYAEIHTCREKLSFEKDKSPASKSDFRKTRVVFTSRRHETINNANTRQAIRKVKDERKVPLLKGIAKGPQASHIAQHAASRCSSIQSCSQNAILFSQQQMNDIERLAQKLITELQSMKDIFVDVLQCESRTGANLRYNTDEVRVAVENATKVEDMARKWLSMMTRDCNRFCKIMQLTESDGGSPEKKAQKGRKITFADEAGGRLCQVKFFETSKAGASVTSPVKSQIRGEAFGA